MKNTDIISELQKNRSVFRGLLSKIDPSYYMWKPSNEEWCLLEVVCHLYDEEREDFRTRIEYVLRDPSRKLPSIDPVGWIEKRKYLEQDYNSKLKGFLKERKKSIKWLQSLKDPIWENAYQHPKLGPLSAAMFLSNWLEHDYLHIRQINRIKHQYLETHSNTSLKYAGGW